MRERVAELYDRVGLRWPAAVALAIAAGFYIGVQVGFCQAVYCG